MPSDFCKPKKSIDFNINKGWNLVGGINEITKINDIEQINENDLIYLHENYKYNIISHDENLIPNKFYWVKRN